MKNLTSELVEEFRNRYQILLRFGSIEDAAKSNKVEVVNQEIGNWLKAAFDRVRAEGREEIIAKLEAISEYALMTPDEMKSGYYQKGWFDCRREIISKFFSQTGQAASGEKPS